MPFTTLIAAYTTAYTAAYAANHRLYRILPFLYRPLQLTQRPPAPLMLLFILFTVTYVAVYAIHRDLNRHATAYTAHPRLRCLTPHSSVTVAYNAS